MKFKYGDILWVGFDGGTTAEAYITFRNPYDIGPGCRMPRGTKEYFEGIGIEVQPSPVWGYKLVGCHYRINTKGEKGLHDVTDKIPKNNEMFLHRLKGVK